MAQQFLSDKNGWLSFNHSTPVLYMTAEDDEFDMETMRAWRDEGFVVKYIPQGNNGKAYVNTLHKLGDGMGIGERYAVVGILAPPSRPRRGFARTDSPAQPLEKPPQCVSTSSPSPGRPPASSAPSSHTTRPRSRTRAAA